MSNDITVTIDGDPHIIQTFRGLKAILVFASIARITHDIPDILADAAKSYYKRNTIIVTEAMSKLPRWEGFSKEDFDDAEARTGLRQVELPAPMTEREQVLSALPQLLESTARREIVRLFAILVIPNEELMAADQADSVNEALDKYQALFLYKATLSELVEVALAAKDAVGQLEPKSKERLGEMLRGMAKQMPWLRAFVRVEPEPTPSTPQTSMPDAPISSIDSPQPTDGTEPQLSMTSPGQS